MFLPRVCDGSTVAENHSETSLVYGMLTFWGSNFLFTGVSGQEIFKSWIGNKAGSMKSEQQSTTLFYEYVCDWLSVPQDL